MGALVIAWVLLAAGLFFLLDRHLRQLEERRRWRNRIRFIGAMRLMQAGVAMAAVGPAMQKAAKAAIAFEEAAARLKASMQTSGPVTAEQIANLQRRLTPTLPERERGDERG